MCRIDTITADDLDAIRCHLDAIRHEILGWALTHPARRGVNDNLASIDRLLGPPLPRIPLGHPPPSDDDPRVVAVDGGGSPC